MNQNEKTLENFLKLYDDMYYGFERLDKLLLDVLFNRYKYLKEELEDHILFEPMKIFKTSHQKWEDELNSINLEIQKLYNEISVIIK